MFHVALCGLELSAMLNLADVFDADKRLSCSWMPLSYANKDIFFSKLVVTQAEILKLFNLKQQLGFFVVTVF